MVLASKHETAWTDEVPQTNAKNACVCATASLNRLTGLTDSSSGAFGFGYDALGRRTSLTRPNGVSTSYSYDNLSRLLGVLHAGGTLPGSTAYTYDAAGNRLTKTALVPADPDPVAEVSQYSYDPIYQLTQTLVGGSLAESYTYDAVGNRLTSVSPASYTYNSSNQLTATSAATYLYDNNGNTTSKTDSSGTTNYTWDYENHLASVELPGQGGTVYFSYDPFGRRIKKVSSAGTAIYVYDGANMIEELNGSGSVVARYTQGGGLDQPLAMYRRTSLSYFQADGLGSVTSITNSSGAVTDSYTYDSFGKLTASSGTTTSPYRYTGRESDQEVGRYYYRARYYDYNTGRFLSEDPLGFGQEMNFYSYVGNNATNLIDPTGLAKCCPTKEQDDIQKGADNARRRLDHLFQFGTAVLPTDTFGNVGGVSGCNERIALYHGKRIPLPSEYRTTINVDPEKHPCNYECTVKHEMVHARACTFMGAAKYGTLTEAQQEMPAYMMELGCYLKMQMDNKLGAYK